MRIGYKRLNLIQKYFTFFFTTQDIDNIILSQVFPDFEMKPNNIDLTLIKLPIKTKIFDFKNL